jgi:hypothetical protein
MISWAKAENHSRSWFEASKWGTGTIAKEICLLLFNAVFHVAAGAVKLQRLRPVAFRPRSGPPKAFSEELALVLGAGINFQAAAALGTLAARTG